MEEGFGAIERWKGCSLVGGVVSGGGEERGKGIGGRGLTEYDGVTICAWKEGECLEVEGGGEVVLVFGVVVVC